MRLAGTAHAERNSLANAVWPKGAQQRLHKVPNLLSTCPPNSGERFMTAATDCHETVIVVTLNSRARFERLIPQPWLFGRARAVFASSWAPVLHFTVMLKTFRARGSCGYILGWRSSPPHMERRRQINPGAPTLPRCFLWKLGSGTVGLIEHNKLALPVSSYASRTHP